MTSLQLLLASCAYAMALLAAVYFTRAGPGRVIGALVGAAVAGLMAMGAIALGEQQGWWHVPIDPTPSSVALFYAGLAISLSPIYLITWRVVRRFGWRGLAACVGIAALIGPPRDYLFATAYPEWMVFGPGVMPFMAIAMTYAGFVGLGHAVMRLVAGPARDDSLRMKKGDR